MGEAAIVRHLSPPPLNLSEHPLTLILILLIVASGIGMKLALCVIQIIVNYAIFLVYLLPVSKYFVSCYRSANDIRLLSL